MSAKRPEAEPVDLEAAMLDPTTVFDDPAEVLANRLLTEAQKATILERWRLEGKQERDGISGRDSERQLRGQIPEEYKDIIKR